MVSALGTTLLIALLRDDLVAGVGDSPRVASTRCGRASSTRRRSSPVAVVAFIVFALLVWVLGSLFGKGHGWARYALTATAVSFVFAMLVIYRADPPVSLLVLGRGRRRSSTASCCGCWPAATPRDFIRGAHLAEEREHST